jgi:hypothetical protein
MLVLKRKKLFLKIGEVYFAEDYNIDIPGVDIVIYVQCLKERKDCREYHTLHMDLEKDTETLLKEMHKSTHRQVLMAANKDNLKHTVLWNPTDKDIEEFGRFYNNFALKKEILLCNTTKLSALKGNNELVISIIEGSNNTKLCSHAYAVDKKRARELYSVSSFREFQNSFDRNAVSRANRYLHWMDMLSFKEKGFSIYDFGGLSIDDGNEVLQRINLFKKGFGGKEVTEYYFHMPKTLLGRIALLYFKWRGLDK